VGKYRFENVSQIKPFISRPSKPFGQLVAWLYRGGLTCPLKVVRSRGKAFFYARQCRPNSLLGSRL